MANRLPALTEINALVFSKGVEHYIFKFDGAHLAEALHTLRRYAANPELSFSWSDAALLTERIRKLHDDGIGE